MTVFANERASDAASLTARQFPHRERRWRLLSVVVLVLLPLLAYLPILRGGYIWDDDYYVTQNANLHSLPGLRQIWLAPSEGLAQCYPLTFTTFWVEYHLWGLRPLGFHVVNVMLHTLSVLLLWRGLHRLGVPGSWMVAAVFAIHPVHVESVAWVAERKNVLSAALYLSAALASLNWLGLDRAGTNTCDKPAPHTAQDYFWYCVTFLLFALALLAKTVTSTLPVLLLLLVYWKRGRISWRDVVRLAPFFAAGAALGGITSWVERDVVGASGPEWHFSFPQRLLIAGQAFWFYPTKLIDPLKLCFMYPKFDIDPSHFLRFVFPIAAVLFGVSLWLLRRRIGRGPLAALLFFTATLFPALGFINVYPMRYSFVADHFQYLASIGVIVLAVSLGRALLQRFASRPERSAAFIGGGVLLLLFGLTLTRVCAFRNSRTLWTDTLAGNPQSWMAHNNLGALELQDRHFELATAEFNKSLAINRNFDAILGLAMVDVQWKHSRKAATKASEALELVASDDTLQGRVQRTQALSVLGVAYDGTGDQKSAEAAFAEVVNIDPSNTKARAAIAQLMAARRDWSGAYGQWKNVARMEPDNAGVHNMLGISAEHTGQIDEAVTEYQLALRLNPNFLQASQNLMHVMVAHPTTNPSR